MELSNAGLWRYVLLLLLIAHFGISYSALVLLSARDPEGVMHGLLT